MNDMKNQVLGIITENIPNYMLTPDLIEDREAPSRVKEALRAAGFHTEANAVPLSMEEFSVYAYEACWESTRRWEDGECTTEAAEALYQILLRQEEEEKH